MIDANAEMTEAEMDEADREYLALREEMFKRYAIRRKNREAAESAVESGLAVLLSSRPANWESYYRNGK